MRSVLALCLAVACLSACGVKDDPLSPQLAAGAPDAAVFDNDTEQGLLE